MADDRDWDRELAKIDRLMGKDPAPSPAPPAAKTPVAARADSGAPPQNRAAPAPASVGAPVRGSGLRVWLTAMLGPVGAAGLVMWPYGTACGTWLWVYLVGVLAVFGASLMTMRTAWIHRRGVAMSLGILTLVAALGLAAMIVLPRLGYAAVSLHWTCST